MFYINIGPKFTCPPTILSLSGGMSWNIICGVESNFLKIRIATRTITRGKSKGSISSHIASDRIASFHSEWPIKLKERVRFPPYVVYSCSPSYAVVPAIYGTGKSVVRGRDLGEQFSKLLKLHVKIESLASFPNSTNLWPCHPNDLDVLKLPGSHQ